MFTRLFRRPLGATLLCLATVLSMSATLALFRSSSATAAKNTAAKPPAAKTPKAKKDAADPPVKIEPALFEDIDHDPISYFMEHQYPRPHGIEKRTLWKTSKVVGSPEPPSPYQVKKTFAKMVFKQPLAISPEPGTDNLLIVQHLGVWAGPGRILRMKDDPDVSTTETLLDIDRIAYSIAFHPNYEENGYLFVGSNGPVKSKNKTTRVSRYTVDRKPPYHCDPKSELVILEWESDGHNGGSLGFSPIDGMLYVTSGDGTSDSDPNLRGQDITHLNSAMLRLDIDHPDGDKPYSVPKDNPFIDTPGARGEVWAYGLRNPWRMTFDRKTGHLWVGNNGQDLWEQVYFIRKGENYGWSVYEGSHPFNLERKRGPTPIVKPTVEHSHAEFRSLTGGVVYYGKQLPELEGTYVYGDWSTGKIWGVRHDGKNVVWNKELTTTTLQITGFGLGTHGELYVIDHQTGFYLLERTPKQTATAKFPTKLSETGIFTNTKKHQVDPGLVPYSVNAPVWADGALQERYLGIPGKAEIDFPQYRGWNLPEGTVLLKTLSLEAEPGNPATRRRVETQMLTRQQNQWHAYCYAWNDDQTDATLVPIGGKDRVVTFRDAKGKTLGHEQPWRHASRTECMICHSRAANFVLGMSEAQLNRIHNYGSESENQLLAWEHLGLLRVGMLEHEQELYGKFVNLVQSPIVGPARFLGIPEAGTFLVDGIFGEDWWPLLPVHLELGRREFAAARDAMRGRIAQYGSSTHLLPKPPKDYRTLVDPYDTAADLNGRARAYLHANCAECHVPAGGGNALMEMDMANLKPTMNIFDIKPQHALFGIADARIITSGDPDRSVLLYRMCKLGGGRMPRVGSNEVDERGIRLMREWIASQRPEPPSQDDEKAYQTFKEAADRAEKTRHEQQADVEIIARSVGNAKECSTAIDHLLLSTDGAMALLGAMDTGRIPKPLRAEVVSRAMKSPQAEVRDLYERFTPSASRVRRLGDAPDPAALLAVEGNAARGKQLFFAASAVECKSCHKIGAGPDLVGPELSHIGKKYNKQQLLESILEPSKTIEPKYQAYLATTDDGKIYNGILLRKTDAEIVLKDSKNQEVRLATQEVESLAPQAKSLMPDLLLRSLTAEQAADLLAYLSSLK